MPWRVADQGLIQMGDLFDEIKSISVYLHEGPTWQRLKVIATKPHGEGGLALFTESSEAFAAFFSQSPPKHQEDRPATTTNLLQWLGPRQYHLGKLIKADIDQRHLTSKHSKTALQSLCDARRGALRRVAAVLLGKALYLFYYTEKNNSWHCMTACRSYFHVQPTSYQI